MRSDELTRVERLTVVIPLDCRDVRHRFVCEDTAGEREGAGIPDVIHSDAHEIHLSHQLAPEAELEIIVVELGERKSAPVLELSGGMRRRLSLAITLVHEPPVVFLDEPTVGVDPALRVQFWSHFRRLADAGTTILVASHVMDEADRCDELVFIRSGQVLAQGTGADLRAKAGTENLETAFLRFAGLDEEGRPLASAAADAQPDARADTGQLS